mgnify:CR=1 FL=1|jgi:O-antigen/teichoic acid export membrane protein
MSFRQKATSIVFFRIICFIGGILIGVLLARLLGPVKLGIVVIIMLIPQYAEKLGRLGLGQSAIYNISKKKITIERAASALWTVSITIGFLPLIFFPFYKDLFVNSFLEGAEIPMWYFTLALLSIPLLFIMNYFKSIIISQEFISDFNKMKVIGYLPSIAAVILIITTSLDISAVIITYFFGNIFSAGLVFYLYMNRTTLPFPSINVRKEDYLLLWNYGKKVYLTTIMSYLHLRIDLLLVALLLPLSQVAYYNLAVNIVEKLWLLNVGNTIFFTRVSSAENGYRENLTAKLCRNTLFTTTVLAAVLWLSADILVELLYGTAFKPIIEPLMILMPGVVLMSIAKLFYSYFNGMNLIWYNQLTVLLTILLNVGLNLILIPIYGITGVALATTITYSTAFIIMTCLFVKISNVSLSRIFLIDRIDIMSYKKLLSF